MDWAQAEPNRSKTGPVTSGLAHQERIQSKNGPRNVRMGAPGAHPEHNGPRSVRMGAPGAHLDNRGIALDSYEEREGWNPFQQLCLKQ